MADSTGPAAVTRYVLRSTTVDGLPLWFTEGGPTQLRERAAEWIEADVERARQHFACTACGPMGPSR